MTLGLSGGKPVDANRVQQARVIPNNDKKRTYSVVYLPKVEGFHQVPSDRHHRNLDQWSDWTDNAPPPVLMNLAPPPQVKVLFAGQDIDRSPFMVMVSKALGDPSRVQARGLGLQQTGNVAAKPTYFDIYTAGKESVW